MYNLLADLLIRQIFFRQMLETSQLAKLFPCQTFSPYGIIVRLFSEPFSVSSEAIVFLVDPYL